MKHPNIVITVVAVLALIGGMWFAQDVNHDSHVDRQQADLLSDKLIDFTLPDLQGNSRSLSEWQGKVILLNFWATWCAPCREEVPLFVALQNQYSVKGLQVIGVAMDSKSAVAKFAREFNINYPLLIGNENLIPLMEQYGNPYGSLPFSVLMRTDGSIVHRKIGAYGKQELSDLVLANIRQTPGQ
ncbi:MAG: TlpA disulfide reductase family protein [Gammaproteobacteria bacterium]|nr:MAG: TlpA disulfide reductase family protein [Gammaproteobacteria bacterium]